METKSYMEVKNLTEKISSSLSRVGSEEARKPLEYKKLIPEAMKAVQKLKEQNWDVTPLIKNLKKAPVLLKGKKYEELGSLTMAVKKQAIATLKNEIILPAKGELDRVTAALKEAKEDGIDVKAILKDLNEAMKLFTAKKYHLVKERVSPIFAYLEDAKGGMSLQQTKMVFEDQKKLIKAYKTWKIQMTKFKGLLKEGEKALKNGEIKESVKVTRKIEKTLKGLKEDRLKKQVENVLAKAKKLIDSSKVKDKDAALLAQRKSRDKLEEEEHVEAWEEAMESCRAAGMKDKDYYKLKCTMANTLVTPRIALLKAYDADMGPLNVKYDKYKKAFKEGKKFQNAFDIISQVAQEAHNLEVMVHVDRASLLLENIVDDYLARGMDIEDVKNLVDRSRGYMEENKYIDALKSMDGAVEKARGHIGETFSSFEVPETECPNCNYSILVLDPEAPLGVKCPVCTNSFEIPPEE